MYHWHQDKISRFSTILKTFRKLVNCIWKQHDWWKWSHCYVWRVVFGSVLSPERSTKKGCVIQTSKEAAPYPYSWSSSIHYKHCSRCRFKYWYQWIPNPFWLLPFDLFYCTFCNYENLIKILLCLKNRRCVFVMPYSLWKIFERVNLNSLWSYVFEQYSQC